jgi:hypothetical protein
MLCRTRHRCPCSRRPGLGERDVPRPALALTDQSEWDIGSARDTSRTIQIMQQIYGRRCILFYIVSTEPTITAIGTRQSGRPVRGHRATDTARPTVNPAGMPLGESSRRAVEAARRAGRGCALVTGRRFRGADQVRAQVHAGFVDPALRRGEPDHRIERLAPAGVTVLAARRP